MDQFADTRSVTEHNGSCRATIPRKLVDDLGIEDGDELLFVRDGDGDEVRVRPAG